MKYPGGLPASEQSFRKSRISVCGIYGEARFGTYLFEFIIRFGEFDKVGVQHRHPKITSERARKPPALNYGEGGLASEHRKHEKSAFKRGKNPPTST